MKTSKRFFCAAVATAIALSASGTVIAAPTTLKLGWVPAIGYACALSVAENLKNDQFKIELLSFKSGNDILLALTTGQLDMGMTGYAVVANALTKADVPAKFVAGATSATTSVIVTAKSGIAAWKDLKGRTVGSVRGSAEHTAMENALANAGLSLGKDVKFVNFQSSTDAMVALRNADIDAMVSYEPAIAMAVDAGYAVRAPEMTKTLFSSTYAISNGFMASDKLIKSHEDWLVTILKAYVNDCKALKKNPDQAIDMYLRYQTGKRSVLIDGYKSIVDGLVWDIPLNQVKVVPRYLPAVDPARVPELSERLSRLVDYGPLSKATGESPAALGKTE